MKTRAALLVLAFALLSPQAFAASPAPPAHPAPALEPVLRVDPDVPQAALDARLHGRVTLHVHVDRAGLVDSVRVVSGDARLRESAAAAARWTVYAPQPAPTWTTLVLGVDGRADSEPLHPDVIAIAREAEAARHWSDALAAWTGALRRLGTHPSLANEWSLREHALHVASRLPAAPGVPGETAGLARGARTEQERAVAGAQHAELVAAWDQALLVAPWWGEPYLWRAGSLAACGRSAEARRSLAFFLCTAPDSAGRWLGTTALQMLAAGDSLGASELVKKRARSFNVDVPGAR